MANQAAQFGRRRRIDGGHSIHFVVRALFRQAAAGDDYRARAGKKKKKNAWFSLNNHAATERATDSPSKSVNIHLLDSGARHLVISVSMGDVHTARCAA